MKSQTSEKKIFISHSSMDKRISDEFVDLLTNSGVDRQKIFYTSMEDFGTPIGSNFVDYIKNNLVNCKLVIILLSPNYLNSKFCMCELGASWAISKQIYPLLIPPLKFSDIKDVLTGIQLGMITDDNALNNLYDILNNISNIINSSKQSWTNNKKKFFKLLEDILNERYYSVQSIKYYQLVDRLITLMLENEIKTVYEIFQDSIIRDLSGYLKEMIDNLTDLQKDNILKFLEELYYLSIIKENHKLSNVEEIVREQCCYYMCLINDADSDLFLNNALLNDNSFFVQRGIYLGTILFDKNHDDKRLKFLNKYMSDLESNPLVASINAGYHQFYYGDKFIKEGYLYDHTTSCKSMLSAICKHLANDDYKYIWPIDLFTLRYIIFYNSTSVFNLEERDIIATFLDRTDLPTYVESEKSKLQELFKGIMFYKDNYNRKIEFYNFNNLYIKKLPTKEHIKNIIKGYQTNVYFDDDFYNISNPIKFPDNYKNKILMDETKMKNLIERIKKIDVFKEMSSITVLDAGCSYGAFIHLWEESRLGPAYGLEISKAAKEAATKIYCKNININIKDATNIQSAIIDYEPDIICCFDYFEHIFNIDLFLYDISISIKKDTYLLLYLPIFKENELSIHILKNNKYFKENHIYYFTLEGLNYVVSRFGFKKVYIEEIHNGKYLLVYKK